MTSEGPAVEGSKPRGAMTGALWQISKCYHEFKKYLDTYLPNGVELDSAGSVRPDAGIAPEAVGTEPLLELPLFNTLLARLMNFEKPWDFSREPDPPGAEELMLIKGENWSRTRWRVKL